MADRERGIPSSSYIPTLDGWRAIAIIAVLFCHGLDENRYPFAVALGYGGVLLFFSISGFLITSRLFDENEKTGRISFRNFYIRRAFRILPPAFFFLLTIAVLGLTHIIPFSLVEILKALFFVRNYAPMDFSRAATWYSAHFWSLSVEEHFYLLWPAILALAGIKRGRWVAPALALTTILWRSIDEKYGFVVHLFHAPYLAHSWSRTDYLADVLLWGCTLALWLGRKPWKPIFRQASSIVGVALILLIGFTLFYGTGHGRSFMYLALALPVGCTATAPRSILGRILEFAPLRYIGKLSYSLYLWQQLFFHTGMEPLRFQRAPWNVVFIVACACISYYCVEKPIIRLGHALTKRPRSKRDVDLGAPKETAEAT